MIAFAKRWAWGAMFLAVAAVGFLGCNADALSGGYSSNANVRVELLTEHDACSVFRFYDGASGPFYYVRCAAVSREAVIQQRREGCGKNCSHLVNRVAAVVSP